MIPLAVPDLDGREREYLNRCIDTTFISSVGELQKRLVQDTVSQRHQELQDCTLP